jgi:hypothetical protein
MPSFLLRYFLNSSIKSNYKITIINITILLFIFRTANPALKFPFVVLYFVIIIYFLKNILKRKLNLKLFIISSQWLLVVFVVLILSLFLSNKVYIIIVKDILNITIIFSLLIFLYATIEEKEQFIFFFENFLNLSIIFAFVNAILLFGSFIGYILPINNLDKDQIDYNFSTIPIFFGIVSILFLMHKKKAIFNLLIYNILLIILSFGVITSGSRRGAMLFAIIIITLIFGIALKLINKNNQFSQICYKAKNFVIIIFTLIGFIYIYLFYTPVQLKYETFKFLGVENVHSIKWSISEKLSKYFSTSKQELYNILWPDYFNPKNPDSGWGKASHKTIHKLSGINADIVPKGSSGYLLDSNSFANAWDGNAHSHTTIYRDTVKKGTILHSYVYCFVSNDFNGTWVRLESGGEASGDTRSIYDLNSKGTWQRLEINANCNNGIAIILIRFAKYGVTDFKSLKGHVIFAYPQHKIIEKGTTNSKRDSIPKLRINSKIKPKSQIKDTLSFFSKIKLSQKASIFNFGSLNSLNLQQKDNAPLRNWIANFVSEDTTYYPYKANIKVDSISDKFLKPRTARWQFAWQIFTKEYNWKEKNIRRRL